MSPDESIIKAVPTPLWEAEHHKRRMFISFGMLLVASNMRTNSSGLNNKSLLPDITRSLEVGDFRVA